VMTGSVIVSDMVFRLPGDISTDWANGGGSGAEPPVQKSSFPLIWP